jgi:hypothetical protein
MNLFFVFLSFLFFWATASAQEPPYLKVSEARGGAEFSKPLSARWEVLLEGAALEKGQRIKTADRGGIVEMVLDERFEAALCLGADSSLKVLSLSPLKISLERGELFILREHDKPQSSSGFLQVIVPGGKINFDFGGVLISVGPQGAWVKVFADEILVLDRRIKEGFKFFIPKKAGMPVRERMTFLDYAPWEAWVKKWYRKKDDSAYSKLW